MLLIRTFRTSLSSPDKCLKAQNEFEQILNLGIFRLPLAHWALPLYMVAEISASASGLCGGNVSFNDLKTPNRYSLPEIQELMASYTGSRYLA